MPWMVRASLLAVLCVAATCAAQDGESPRCDPPAPGSTSGSAPASDSLDELWSSPEIAAPRMESQPLHRHAQTRAQQPPGGDGGRVGTSWFRTTASLTGVLALIVLLTWGYRVVMTSSGRLRAPGARGGCLIEVVGRTTLAPRQALCLVRVGPRLVLLGTTHETVRALDVIDDPQLAARLLGEAARGRCDSHTAEFNRCLEQEASAYVQKGEDIDEAVTPDEPRIREIREKLADAIGRLRATGRSA